MTNLHCLAFLAKVRSSHHRRYNLGFAMHHRPAEAIAKLVKPVKHRKTLYPPVFGALLFLASYLARMLDLRDLWLEFLTWRCLCVKIYALVLFIRFLSLLIRFNRQV